MKTIKLREREVEYCLKHFPETRNSDITLLIKIWEQYHQQRIFETPNGDAVLIKDLYDLPREDAVKRIRANFNSKRKYLPTSEKVAKQRQMNIAEWREWLRAEGSAPDQPEPPKEEAKCPHGLPLFVSCPQCK